MIAHAMTSDGWLFPTYRSNAMQITRDVSMSDLLAFRRRTTPTGSAGPTSSASKPSTAATQVAM
jgi:TPP-dependent pyruvate/acetoin dehydrogenase alpha subunit